MTDQAVDTGGIEVPQQGQRSAAGQVPGAPAGRWFLGRAQELRELRADIERAGLDTIAGRKAARARVLLIAGRPGSGRSALAEEFAARLTQGGGRYPDGVLRARLAEPDGTPVPTARAARTLLAALRLPAPPGAGEDDLTATLRDGLATRRAVLLLDGATGAEQVDPLLPDAPDCLVVAVSEGPLTGIPGVRPCTLGGLDTPSAVQLLSSFTGSVRITCDPRAAEHLAEACGRLPAALKLAGGWLGTRPRASVAELATLLHAAGTGAEGAPLERVFAFVYADLPAPAARMLRLLGQAPTALADPQTASALAGCSVTDAHAALDDLAALGLVRSVDSPLPQYAVPDCLLPMLRDLAAAQDRPAELQLARARMLERNVTLLQSCRAVTEPDGSPARRKLAELPAGLRFPSRRAAGRWLAIRQPALLAAARAAVADGDLDTLARRLIAALVRALAAHRGPEAAAAELYTLHELLLEVAARRGLHREQAAALLNLADLDARTGRTRAALGRYRAALDAGRAADDAYATGRAMESIGGAYQELDDFSRAADWFGRALAQRLARDERGDAARLYGRLAAVQTLDGRHHEALRNWRAAVAGHRKTGDVPGQARALSELARVQEHAGRLQEALRTCRAAGEAALKAGDEGLRADLELRLAGLYEQLGDPVAARLHRTLAERAPGTEDPRGGPSDGGDPATAQETADGDPDTRVPQPPAPGEAAPAAVPAPAADPAAASAAVASVTSGAASGGQDPSGAGRGGRSGAPEQAPRERATDPPPSAYESFSPVTSD